MTIAGLSRPGMKENNAIKCNNSFIANCKKSRLLPRRLLLIWRRSAKEEVLIRGFSRCKFAGSCSVKNQGEYVGSRTQRPVHSG